MVHHTVYVPKTVYRRHTITHDVSHVKEIPYTKYEEKEQPYYVKIPQKHVSGRLI